MRYLLLFLIGTFTIVLNIILLPFRIVLSLFGVSFRSPKSPSIEDKDIIKMDREGDILNMNYDNLNEEEREDFQEAIAEKVDVSSYEGEVKHAYALKYVKDPNACPRCQSEVQRHYANFIYATQIAPRVMFAPAGFFCIECPTVIIDHEMIKTGIDKKFKFQGVVGIEYATRKQTDLFETWNGKKTVYIFDENHKVLGLSAAPLKSHSQHSTKKNQKKKQIAKQSRRKNRRT